MTVTFGDSIKKHLTDAETRLTGKKFCTTCQRLQHAEGGEKARFRWICAPCVQRRNNRENSWKKS